MQAEGERRVGVARGEVAKVRPLASTCCWVISCVMAASAVPSAWVVVGGKLTEPAGGVGPAVPPGRGR